MSASSTWESFSTFLDTQQQPNAPAPGQMPDWSQNFQLGQPPNYSEHVNINSEPLFPTGRPGPGQPVNDFNPNQPSPFQQQNGAQYGVQQMAGVTEPSRAMDPAGALFASFGQGNRHAERQRNRGGAYGSAKRDKLGNWSFNER